MAGPMCDCYVLARNRSAEVALAFLDQFLPRRQPTWDPADPTDVLGIPENSHVADVLSFLASHTAKSYRLYWSSSDRGPPYHAVVAFNADGSLALGLSCDEEPEQARQLLEQLLAFAGSDYGYWGVEEPPAGSRQEFLKRLGVEE